MVGVDQLKIGNKYTIVKFNQDGMPCKIHCRITKIIPSVSGTRIDYRTNNFNFGHVNLCKSYDVIIWNDFIEPDVDIGAHESIKDNTDGRVKVLWRWCRFSPRYMERAKASIEQHPVVINYKPKNDKIPDRLFVIGEVVY